MSAPRDVWCSAIPYLQTPMRRRSGQINVAVITKSDFNKLRAETKDLPLVYWNLTLQIILLNDDGEILREMFRKELVNVIMSIETRNL